MYSFSGPAEVKGRYQKLRSLLHPILILVFLVMPWISIHGQPALLFDIINRHFIIFGFTFFSHDAPLLFFLAILLILSIFIVTALFGRLWCGWSCPQTVFLHGLFNQVEKLILGPYTKRFIFYKSGESFGKIFRILSVYVIFFILSWILAHSFVAYFIGAQAVTRYIIEGPSAHLSSFVVLLVMTTTLFLNFAFFREKLCFYVCPYGRFQNALIDSNSLTVFYDVARGEPRGKLSAATAAGKKGDCIDCNRCVSVCPTKIDIRQGFQLECIACGKCIDACNEVMTKVKQPPNLIRYDTATNKPITFKTFRLGLYAILFVIFLGALIFSLAGRSAIDINITRAHLNPFSSRFENGKKIIQNQILIHLKNQTANQLQMELQLSKQNQDQGYHILTPAMKLNLEPDQDVKTPAFVEIEDGLYVPGKNEIQVQIKAGPTLIERSIQFIKVE